MQTAFCWFLSACLLVVISTRLAAADIVDAPRKPVVWMIPPPWDEGACLKELVNNPEQWSETRTKVDGMGYYLWLLNHQFSDSELKSFFRKLKLWKMKFSFEIPVIKGANWGFKDPLDAKSSFDKYQQMAKRFEACGMRKVDAFTFDEPIYASIHPIPQQVAQGILPKDSGLPGQELSIKERMQYGIKQTVSFIEMLRKTNPDSQLGDIEPYPVLTYDEITTAIDSIQTACADKGIKGLDFFRIDFDWASMMTTNRGSWTEVKKIEDYCKSKGIKFGMIYWAPDHEFLVLKGKESIMDWYVGLMHHGTAYALVDGKPDEVVLQSWMHIPVHAVPESDITTFSRSVLDFCKSFVDRKGK